MIRFSEIPAYSDLLSEEKNEIKDLILDVKKSSNTARREGILTLEVAVEEKCIKNKFYGEMLKFMIDGNSAEDIAAVAINLITTTKCSDFEKLKMQIAANGVLLIQEGTNPSIAAYELLSMLGCDAFFELKEELCRD